jgi:hypothetical protein
MHSPAAQALSLLQSILLSLGQSINHDNALFISNYYISRKPKNKSFYLILCTFSVEINESRLSDTRCMIQDVVSPHCGDKRMARRCTKRSLPNYFDMTSYHWNVRQNIVTWHWWMSGKNNVTSCTKCSLPESIVHILIQPLLFVWNSFLLKC